MTPRENLIKEEKHMTHLINSITPFSALEDRKDKAVHFNKSHILKRFLLLKCCQRPVPCPKECCYLMDLLQIYVFCFEYKEARV